MYLRAAVGQWLPDWRPDTDHRLSYGASQGRGGGVIFDLIHEIDIVNWLGGRIVEVVAMAQKVPLLEIDTEAVAQIGLKLESGKLAQVHLDYVRPCYKRSLEVVGRKGILSWDYSSGEVSMCFPDGKVTVVHKTTPEFNRNSMFLACIERLLKRMTISGLPAISSFQDGVHALRVALACHKSIMERRSILLNDIDKDSALDDEKQ
jgi:predicted dehydrogenase